MIENMNTFDAATLKDDTYNLVESLNNKKFNPTPFIKHCFMDKKTFSFPQPTSSNSDEIDLIREIKVNILDAEQEIENAEKQILMDKKNYDMEKEVSQATLMYEVEDFLNQYTSIKSEVKSCLNSTSVNDEQVSIAGLELQSLSDVQNEQNVLKNLCDLLTEVITEESKLESIPLKKYESTRWGELDLNPIESNKKNLQSEVLLLNVLNRSVKTCEIDQLEQYEPAIALKFEMTQFQLLDILKKSIFNQEYKPIVQIKDYIEQADLLDMVELIYLESMVGSMQQYGIAEKESNIGELTRYYFILSRLIQNLDSKEGFCFEYYEVNGKNEKKSSEQLNASEMQVNFPTFFLFFLLIFLLFLCKIGL